MSTNDSKALVRAGSKSLERQTIEGEFVLCSAEVTDVLGALVTFAISVAGSVKIILELLKLWVKDRASRRIKIKKGDVELELQGGMSKKELDTKIKAFLTAIKDVEKDEKIKILLP